VVKQLFVCAQGQSLAALRLITGRRPTGCRSTMETPTWAEIICFTIRALARQRSGISTIIFFLLALTVRLFRPAGVWWMPCLQYLERILALVGQGLVGFNR
jgi:hypothetical protein